MGAFELLNPRGLWLLGGLVPLVVLYVLKIQRQRQRVPSTWLWAAAQRDLLAKNPWKRLKVEPPLIVQIVALILLSLALARPAARGGTITGNHVAIVIDTSASMGTLAHAAGTATTRMAEAQKAARSVVDALTPGADAIVIEGAKEARNVSALERDAKRLRAAIDGLGAREVEGDLAGAVALAADRLRPLGGEKRIVIITDGALAHDTPLVVHGIDTTVLTIGDAEDNAAIVRIDVRGETDPVTKREHMQVFVMVRNYSPRPRDTFVTLSIEGAAEPVASRRVLVPPDDKVPVVLTFEPSTESRGKGLAVQLASNLSPTGDALPSDDVAFGRIPQGYRMPVTLASPGSYSWIARALEADSDVALQRITVDQLATVNVDPDALVIVEGACPPSAPGHDRVIVAPPEGRCEGIEVGPSVDQPRLTSWEGGDPRFRFLTLDGVHVARAQKLETSGASAALVRAGTATLVADASVPGRTVTVVGFDPGDSDWPLKASFVLFVRNVVEVARMHRAQGGAGPIQTGDAPRVAVPSGVTAARIEGPGMADHEILAKGGFALIPSIERAGLYHVRWTEPQVGSSLIAANLTSERESDVRSRTVVVGGSGSTSAATTTRLADPHHEWGAWLALAASLLIAFDIWWLTRSAFARAPQLEASSRRAS